MEIPTSTLSAVWHGPGDLRLEEFRRAVDLLARLDLGPLITRRFPLHEIDQAIAAARSRQGIRVLVGG